ncbi:MAG: hypothetical protein K0S65_6105 [Labilithrix sp.]|nr:hypothetical protein [Labilithrix sp.]
MPVYVTREEMHRLNTRRLLAWKSFVGTVVVVGGLVVMAGCSVTPDTFSPLGTPGVGGNTANQGESCDVALKYGKAACERIERCGHREDRGVFMERCERVVAAYVKSMMPVGDVDNISACADTLDSAACGEAGDCFITMFPSFADEIVAKGGPCTKPTHCEGTLGCVAETCQERLAEGGACAEAYECQQGLSCQDGKCAPVVDGVTSCQDLAACDDGRPEPTLWGNAQLYGRPNTFACGDDRICHKIAKGAKLGESCGATEKDCVPELICDSEGTKTCIQPPAYGQTCEGIATCKHCVDLTCLDPIEACE